MKHAECESCAAKPGAPTLCAACLHNRAMIHRLSAALRVASQSFDASDWRAMAEECARRAEEYTCPDCDEDLSLAASLRRSYPTGKPEHRRVGTRWACGVKP